MDINGNDEWYGGFTSWEQVRSLMRSDDWSTLRDDRQRLEVQHSGEGLVVYDWRSVRLRARHRRGLHKLGFRATAHEHVTLWDWDVAPALTATVRSEHDELLERLAQWARPESVAAARRRFVGGDLIVDQARRVLEEVYRSEVRDLAVAVYREPEYSDEEYEDDDQEWPLPSR